jgi:hypothetical protein
MNKFQVIGALALLGGGFASAQPAQTGALQPTPAVMESASARLLNLARNLPAVGETADFKTLGLQLAPTRGPAPKPTGTEPDYKIYYPLDLDTRSTDEKPFAGKYPGVQLNLPLKVQPSYINFLFLSDQPERILDTRKRTPATMPGSPEPGPGATGIYARSPIPGRSTVRVLVDHTNGTKRPLRFDLMWLPESTGFLTVRKRSLSVHKDSVAAGKGAFGEMGEIVVEPRVQLDPDKGHALISQLLEPEQTVVVHQEFFVSGRGHLAAIVSEVDAPVTDQVAELDSLPVLHSIVWKEEEDRLGKFIDKNQDPTRWDRIKESFQHARGHFASPDRVAEVDYAVKSWDEKAYPLRVYSKFESIPGVDVTVKRNDAAAVTNNRGKYGARVGMRWSIKALPPGCREVAIVALNRGAVFGGRHWVSDGQRTAAEVLHLPGGKPGLLRQNNVSTLWRGPVSVGDQLQMWTEPMANTSVQLWYMLVPIPAQ